MKKNKSIKREVKSKNKYFGLAVILVLVAFALVGFNRILGQNAGIITSVCKTNGGILMDKDNCPGGSFKYDLVASGMGSEGGSVVPISGDIAFFDGGYVLKKDKTIWVRNGETGVWSPKGAIGVDVDKILQWSYTMFLTSDGVLYNIDQSTVPAQWVAVTNP